MLSDGVGGLLSREQIREHLGVGWLPACTLGGLHDSLRVLLSGLHDSLRVLLGELHECQSITWWAS